MGLSKVCIYRGKEKKGEKCGCTQGYECGKIGGYVRASKCTNRCIHYVRRPIDGRMGSGEDGGTVALP